VANISQETLNHIELKDDQELSEFDLISELWPQQPANRIINVILKRPPGSECAYRGCNPSSILTDPISHNHS
jgi:hypothetical protein